MRPRKQRNLVIVAALAACALHGQSSPVLSIGNYQDVGEQRLTHTQQYVTYSADLINTGPALTGVTATVTSLSPGIQVIAGEATLHFPAVPANGRVTSADTFTILVDNSYPFSFSNLQWSFVSPVASAGLSQTVAVGSKVTLDGSGSTNPSGGSLTYLWSFASRPAASNAVIANPASAITSFTADVPGNYLITLTVSNGAGSASANVAVSTGNSPPVAVPGPNQIAAPGAQVTLDGSGSFDVNGNPITYSWSMISQPQGSAALLVNPDTVSPTFVPDLPGLYIVQLVVSDGTLSSNPVTVLITSLKTPPVARAGPDQVVNAGSLVSLNGAASTDADGDMLTFRWSFLSIPANSSAVLNGASSVNPVFTADVPGTYIVQLIVNDGTTDSAPSTLVVTTNIVLEPIANAGPNQTVLAGTVVALSGSGSDPQALPLTMKWSMLSEPAGSRAVLSGANTPNPTFQVDQSGTYVEQLIVNNGYLNSAPSTVAVTTTTNTLPVANPGPGQNVLAGVLVNLDGSRSSDANNRPLSYAWSFTSIPAGSTATLLGPNSVSPAFFADVPGPYVVQLIVNDTINRSLPATAIITASAPSITLTPNPLNLTQGAANLTVTLTSPAGPSGEVVNFSGFDPTIVSMPASVTVPANAKTAAVTVTPLAVGTTNVLASGTGFQSGNATIVVPGTLQFTPSTFTVTGVATRNVTLTLSAPAPTAGLTVNLSANPSGIVTVPASVTIAKGTTAITVPVTGAGVGTTTITASSGLAGVTAGTASVTVQSAGAIALAATAAIGPAQTTTLAVTLPAAAPQAVTVTLSSNSQSIATVSPQTVTIATGQTQPATQPQVTGVNFGSTAIVASASGYTNGSQNFQVGATLNFPGPVSPIAGTATENVTLTLSVPAPSALTVNLSASPSGIVTIPASVTIAKNATSVTVPVTGVSVGSTVITATATASTVTVATVPVTVQTANAITLTPNVTVGPGQSAPLTVSLPSAATQTVTVTLSSSDTTKVTITPSQVTIATGQTQPATQPQVTGVNFGSATINASASGFNSGSQTVNCGAALGITPQTPTVTGVGSQNVTVTLSATTPVDLPVTLTALPAGVVTVPASVTIPANSTSKMFAITGVSVGAATVTASSSVANISSGAANVTVQSAGTIALLANVTVAPGQSAPMTVTLPAPVPQAVTVALSSDTPANVTISPATVTIAAGQTQPATQPQVTGVNFGSAAISASAGGYATGSQTVTVGATLSLTPQTVTLNGPATTTLTATLSAPAPAPLTVNLSANPTGIVSFPAYVTIAKNASTAGFSVTGAGTGTTVVTASSTAPNVTSGTASVTVQSLGAIAVSANPAVLKGQSTPLSITLPAAAPTGGAVVTLSSSDSTILSISPNQVTIAAGLTQPATPPQVTGANLGTATVTASSPLYTSGAATVETVGTISFSPPILNLVQSDIQNLTLTLSAPAPAGGLTFLVTSSNANVATVGSNFTIAANSTTVSVPVSAIGPGAATITASAPNMTAATAIAAVTARVDILVPATVSVQPGNTTPFAVSLAKAAVSDTVVNLSSGNTNVATVSPSSVTISAGQTQPLAQPTITGVASGQATITASATGLNPATSQVTVAAMDIVMPATLTLSPGDFQEFPVSLAKAAQNATVINLTSSNSAVASVQPSSVTIDQGQTQPNRMPNITANAQGMTTITASATGLASGTTQVTVGLTATLTPANLTISGSGDGTLSLTLSAPTPSPITFTVTSKDPTIVTAPPSVYFSSGTQVVAFKVTAVSTGSTVVTATAPGFTAMSSNITVQPPGTLSMSVSSTSIQLNQSGTVTLTLSTPAPPSGIGVNVNSSNSNLSLGTTLIFIAPGSTTGSTTFTAMNVGSASLSASATGFTSPAPVVVNVGATIQWNPSTLTVSGGGQQAFLYLQLSTTVPQGPNGIPIMLTSSRPDVATVPPTLSFYWDGSTAPTLRIQVDTVGPGATIIHASGVNIPGVDATVTVTGPFSISTASLPNGATGGAYSTTLNAAGGVKPYTWSATGLPSNLSINSSTGQISGVPAASGASTVNVTVTDSTTPTHLNATATYTLTVNAPVPASIAVSSGSPQNTSVTTTFATPLAVVVKDASQNPLGGVVVTFLAPATGASGTFAGGVTTATTNTQGIATAPPFTANGTVGSYSVTASAGSLSTTFALANVLGSAAKIAVSGGSGQTAPVNTAFANPLVAKVTDAGGNPVPNVTVTFTAPPQTGPSATFAGGAGSAITNASGVATSAALSANGFVGGPYSVVASSGSATSASFALTNTQGAAAKMVATSGSGQSAQINTLFTSALVVTVTDAGGTPVQNATVTFTAPANGPTGTFTGGVSSVTASTSAQGVAAAPVFTANSVAGNYSVTATLGTLSASFSLTNTPGQPSKIAPTSGGGQTAPVNNAFANPLVATVTDAAGNPVPGVNVTFTAPAQSGASATFAGGVNTATTNASGVATSALIAANGVAGGPYNVVASFGSSATATFALTNAQNLAARITATAGGGQSTQIGTAFAGPLVATVTDAGGNPVPNAVVTFTAPAQSGASITFAGGVNSATTNVSGVATSAAITANSHVGAYSVVASSGTATTASYSLTNNTGAAAKIVATSGGGQSAQIGTAFTSPLVATVTDSAGNPVPNATVTFTAPAQSGASVTFAGGANTATTNASGVATSAAITANSHAGAAYNVTASSGTATTASFSLTNSPGPAANIAATSGGGQSALLNTAFAGPLVATVTDSGGNPVPNAIVTFTAPAQSGASVTFAGGANTATTNASGVATSAAMTANGTVGAYNVVASSGAATTASFALTNSTMPAAKISVSGGSGQTAQIGTAFPGPLVAIVTDAGGNPVPNAVVTFAAPAQTGASITFAGGVNTATTNASGIATSTAITANNHAGAYSVVASSGTATTASFSLTNSPGPAATIAATSGTGQSAQIGTAFTSPLVATVTDSGGNPVPNAIVTFTAPAQSGASVTFAGGANTATTNASGVATSAAITANSHAGGAYNVVASSGAATTASFSLTNNPSTAATIAVSGGSGQSAQIGTTFTGPLVATVTDSGGNPVPNAIVTFTPPAQSSASVTFAGNANTATTNASGVATSAAITANSHVGAYSVVASSGTATTASFALTNNPGAPATIAMTGGSGQSAQIGTAFASPLVATVTDSGGNPAPNAVVTFTAPAQTGASVTFAGGVNTATTNASGIATSAAITANSHVGAYSVVASSGTATTAGFALTNVSGPAAKVAATSGSGQSAKVNTTFAQALVATVTDASGNPVPNTTVTFTAPAQTGASVVFAGGVTTAVTNAAGVATSAPISANGFIGGPYTVTASSGAATPANFTLTNTVGTPANIVVTSGSGQSATILTAFAAPLVATVTDSGGNPVPSATVTFTAPAQTGSSATFAGSIRTATTNAQGVATSAVVTANSLSGSYSVVASSGTAQTASFALTNNPGTAAKIAIASGNGQSAQVNNAFTSPLAVIVTDSGGNPVANVVVTFTAPAQTGASATFAGGVNTATTNASGVATSAVLTANGIVGGPYLIGATSGTASKANFSLTNTTAAAATIVVTSGNPQSAQINAVFANPLVVTVTDSGGNPVKGASVTFTAPPQTGASVTFAGGSNMATTNSSGVATIVPTANSHAGGPYSVVASSGPATTATFALTNTIGPAASIALTGGNGQSAQVNTPFANPLTATVSDAGGNPVPNVTVVFTAPPQSGPSAVFSGGINSAITNASGVATSTTIGANGYAGSYNVSAASGAASANFALTNLSGQAATITASAGSGQSTQVTQSFAGPLVALVEDASGNPVKGVVVTFTAPPQTGPSVTFTGSVITATTNAQGLATSAAIKANTLAGAYNVVASAGTASSANLALTNTAGPPASIALTGGSGQSTQVNTAFANPLVATVTDSRGNPAPNVTVTFTAPPQTGASAIFAGGLNTAITNAAGVATSASIAANGFAGSLYKVVATAGSATANFVLTNVAGAPATITVDAGSGQSAQVLTSFASPLVVTVADAAGNLLKGAVVTFTAPAQTGSSVKFANGVITATTNAQGIATSVAITANKFAGGPYNVVASSGTATASLTLTNTTGPAASIALTGGSGQSTQVNTAFANPLVATVMDASGNPVANATVTFTPPAQSGPSVIFAGGANTATTNAAGVATSAAITANSVAGGPYSVNAASGAASANFSLTNTPGQPARIAISGGSGQNAQVTTAFANPLSVVVTDALGNLLKGAVVTFTAPAQTGPSVTFAGGVITATTNAQGVATSAAITANTKAGGPYNVVASSGPATTASFTLTNNPGPAAAIAASGGSGQTVLVNTAFANPLTATVSDANGNPIANAIVTFTAPAQTGPSVTFAGGVNTATTNAQGVATSAVITANTYPGGPYNVVASSGTATSANFALTNFVGAPAKIAVSGGSGQSAQVTTAFANPLAATVTDANNNPVPNATVTFTAPAQTGPSVTFAGGVITATTNAQGVATSAAITANTKAGGPYNVVASSGTATTANFALTNNPGPAAKIAASGGSGQSVLVNTAFANPLAATVTDANGNPVANATVTFTAPAQTGPSVVFAGGVNTATTNAQGVATAPAITANSHPGGPYNVVASSGTATTANFALTNFVGPPANVAASGGSGQSTQVGTAFASPLSATVTDASGNPVPNVTVTFAAPVLTSPSAVFTGGVNTATTNAQGVATSATLTANSLAGTYSVTASTGTAKAASFTLTNKVGPPVNILATSGNPQSAIINTQFSSPLAATVTDSGGNPVPGVTVTFTPPISGTPSVTFAGGMNQAVTNAQGIATSVAMTANGLSGGPYQVVASFGTTATTTFLLTNLIGGPSSLTVLGGSQQQTVVGTMFTSPLQVLLTDAQNNPVSGVTVTFSAPASGPSLTFAGGRNTAVTNANGIATSAIVTANSAVGAYLVTAQAGTLSTALSLSNLAGPPAAITVVSGSPQSTPINTGFAGLAAKVTDAAGNPLRGQTVTFTAPDPTTGPSGVFNNGQNTAITDGTGVATAPQFTANGFVGSYNVVATVSGTSVATSFQLTNTGVAGGPVITVTNTTIGKNLQANILITLTPTPPAAGVIVTIASGDPTKALILAQGAGRASAGFTITPGLNPFSAAIQALAGSGTTSISITAPGYQSASSAIAFQPSGVVISGTNGIGGAFNVFEGTSTPLTVTTGYLDSSNKFVAAQALAIGQSVTAKLTSSNTGIGTVSPASVTISAGNSSAAASFSANASTTGSSNVTVNTPTGFTTPAAGTSLAVTVQQASLVPFTTTIGQGLQKSLAMSIGAPASTQVDLTLTSNAPTQFTFSCSATGTATTFCTPDGSGLTSITLTVPPGHDTSPTFYIQGVGNSGSAGYTASSTVLGMVTGTVNLAHAGFQIQSPGGLGAANFTTPVSAGPSTIQVFTGSVDSGGNFLEQESVAFGGSVSVSVTSSDTSVGTISSSPFTIAGPTGTASTTFQPKARGAATITVSSPGFASAQVTANVTVTTPPLLLTQGDTTIGQNLETEYLITIPQNAGLGGLQVTLTSSSSQMAMATTPTGAASSPLIVTIAAGTNSVPVYVQSLASSGMATLAATATGYTQAQQVIQFAPSAIVLSPIFVSANAGSRTSLGLYVALLDDTGTPQPTDELLAGSQSVNVPLSTTSVNVAPVPASIAFPAGSGSTILTLTLGVAGSATISITEPAGFTTPSSPSLFASTTANVQSN